MQFTIALAILALTIVLAASRIQIKRFTIDHAIASLIGASLMVVCKIVPTDVWQTSLSFLYKPMITITSLMIITVVADHSGLFRTIVQFIVERAKGDGKKLYGFLFLFGSFLGMFFSNEAVVLLFTPMVFSLVESISKSNWKAANKIPYYFAVLAMANLVGGLTFSNPMNLVVASRFNIDFLEYARWMMVPSIVAIIVIFFALFYFFTDQISDDYKAPPRKKITEEQRLFQMWVAVSLGVTCLFLLFSRESISQFALPICAIVNVVLFRIFSDEKADLLVKEMGLSLIVFIYGMFIIAMGLRNSGLADVFKDLFNRGYHNHFTALSFIVGIVSAVGSAFTNNHVTVNFLTWVLKDLNMDIHEVKILAYSVIIGGNVGPIMFPLGSLATVMWLRILQRRGVKIGFFRYLKLGIPVSLSAIILALLALNIEYGLTFL